MALHNYLYTVDNWFFMVDDVASLKSDFAKLAIPNHQINYQLILKFIYILFFLQYSQTM